MPTYFGASKQGGEQVALFGDGGNLRMRPNSGLGRTTGMRAMSGGGFGNFAPQARGFAGPVIGSRSFGMFAPQSRGMGMFSPMVRGFGDASQAAIDAAINGSGSGGTGSSSGGSTTTNTADNGSTISASTVISDIGQAASAGATIAGIVTGKGKPAPKPKMASSGATLAIGAVVLATVGAGVYFYMKK